MKDESAFQAIHRQLLDKPTVQDIAFQSRLSTAAPTIGEDTQKQHAIHQRDNNQYKWDHNLIIHYTHEKRLNSYKTDIHRLWNHQFKATPVIHTRLIAGNKNNPNLKQQLKTDSDFSTNYQSTNQPCKTSI